MLKRAIARRRISFSQDEVLYLIDIMDNWAESYKHLEMDEAATDIVTLHEDMSVAIDIRDKLWRQLNG